MDVSLRAVKFPLLVGSPPPEDSQDSHTHTLGEDF